MTTQVSGSRALPTMGTASVRLQALAALLFGVVILFAVAFTPIGVAHNAAHDSRHSLTFPCH